MYEIFYHCIRHLVVNVGQFTLDSTISYRHLSRLARPVMGIIFDY